ncbi:MAG: CPBP family intramembrane metalloprotease [Acidobacteria bacterium]|nr:CPBP family intramembrane metalloprotease [Acidobacteriota bacterium]
MRRSIVRAIYLKELRETLRDRRTITFMLVLPLLLYPMLIIGMSRFQQNLEKESAQRTAKVLLWGEPAPGLLELLRSRNFDVAVNQYLPGGLGERLRMGEFSQFEPYPDAEDPDADKKMEELRDKASNHPLAVAARPLVLDRKTDAVLVLLPGGAKDGKQEVMILFDSVRQDSRRVRGRLGTALDEYRKQLLRAREESSGLEKGFTAGLGMESRDVAPKLRRSGFSVSITLPFVLLAISATAGFYRAVETTAGEKERNTMQTLLCAPVRPLEIVVGKFAAIATITLIAAAANITSLGLTFNNVSRQMSQGSSLGPSQYVLVFVVLVPVTFLTSALFLAIGVFAKDFRDGQNLATPVMMLTMMPAAVTMLPGVEANMYTVFLPCVNVALLIKALLVGEAQPDFIFLTLVSSAAYATLALLFAARVFERENLLTGGKDTFRGLFGFGDKRREVTPSMAFAMFCGVLVLLFYGSTVPKIDIRFLLVVTQYGMILAPVVLAVLAMKLPVKETLSLRWPGWRPMVAGVLVGLSAGSAASLTLRLLPPPESLAKSLQKVMMLDRVDIPIAWILFAVSISPGICEELLFRGFMQGAFRKLGMWASIGLSAFLFAVAHASIYRMMPVLLLGLAIGWLFWHSKSVLPGMVAHALNNGLAVAVISVPAIRDYFVKNKLQFLPLEWSLAGLVVCGVGLWLVVSRNESA